MLEGGISRMDPRGLPGRTVCGIVTRDAKKIFRYNARFLFCCLTRQGNLLHSAAMRALRSRVVECVRGETGGSELGRCLAGHALQCLRESAARPGPRALACVFETPHPYDNNMVSLSLTARTTRHSSLEW